MNQKFVLTKFVGTFNVKSCFKKTFLKNVAKTKVVRTNFVRKQKKVVMRKFGRTKAVRTKVVTKKFFDLK